MLPETLTKNIAGSLPNVGDGLKNLTNLVVEHAAPAFKAFASNPYVLATAHELLKAKGLPTSAGGVAALGMQRVVGALGKGAKGTLAKAFFAGATTQLATKVNDALGGGTLEALFKSTPAEPEAP